MAMTLHEVAFLSNPFICNGKLDAMIVPSRGLTNLQACLLSQEGVGIDHDECSTCVGSSEPDDEVQEMGRSVTRFEGAIGDGGAHSNGRRVVVVSVNGSGECGAIVAVAKRTLLRKSDIVVLVTVRELVEERIVDYRIPGMLLVHKKDICRYNEHTLRKTRSMLKRIFLDHLRGYDVYPMIVSLGSKSKVTIGATVCKLSEAVKAELVVVGSRGHSAVKQLFFGSVSQYVAKRCSCPVVVV